MLYNKENKITEIDRFLFSKYRVIMVATTKFVDIQATALKFFAKTAKFIFGALLHYIHEQEGMQCMR